MLNQQKHAKIFVEGLRHQTSKKYVLTNKYGTKLNTVFFGDLDPKEIMHFTNSVYSVYESTTEAQDKINFFLRESEKNKDRWGEETYNEVVGLIKDLKIKQI